MTIHRALPILALLAAAACSSNNTPPDGDVYQRGGGYSRVGGQARPMLVPTSAAALAVDHATELNLAADQRYQLEQIRRQVDSANAPLRVQLDSLRPTSRPVNSRDMSEEQREEMRNRRTAVAAVIGRMRDNATASRERTFAILSTEQRQKVEQLEADARKRMDDEMKRVGRSDDADQYRRGGRRPED
jgi:hypothetical protein